MTFKHNNRWPLRRLDLWEVLTIIYNHMTAPVRVRIADGLQILTDCCMFLGYINPSKVYCRCWRVCICVCVCAGKREALYFDEITYFTFQDDVFKFRRWCGTECWYCTPQAWEGFILPAGICLWAPHYKESQIRDMQQTSVPFAKLFSIFPD